MTKFDDLIKSLALHIREELSKVEEISSIDFEVSIDGRAHDGELKIKYSLGSTYGSGGLVTGGRLEPVITEYLRRFGWDRRNKPLELSYDGEITETEA